MQTLNEIINSITEANEIHLTFPLTTSRIGMLNPEDKACIVMLTKLI